LPGWEDASFGARAADGRSRARADLARAREGDSVPPMGYGDVVASRPLAAGEPSEVLELAFRELKLRRLAVRLLDLESRLKVGEHLAWASVVPIATDEPPAEGYSRLTRRSLRKALDAGASVQAGADAGMFWPVYESASGAWGIRLSGGADRRARGTWDRTRARGAPRRPCRVGCS